MRTANYNDESMQILQYSIKFPEKETLTIEEDPYDGLTEYELQRIEKSREQIKKGMYAENSEVFKRIKESGALNKNLYNGK